MEATVREFVGTSRGEHGDGIDGEKLRVWDMMDQVVESPRQLEAVALDILDQKNEALAHYGIAPDYEGEITRDSGRSQFVDPEKIATATQGLAAELQDFLATWNQSPSIETWAQVQSSLVALTELQIFGATGIARSQRLHERKQVTVVGIQPEQIEAALSIETMHSTQMESGQGKSSVSIPIAAVGRHLLTREQIHLMVFNDEAKRRDSQRIEKLTSIVGMRVEALSRESARANLREEIYALSIACEGIDCAVDIPKEKREALKKQYADQLEEKQWQYGLESAKAVFEEDSNSRGRSDIIIGDDRDFIHDYIGERSKGLWGRKRSIIYDEADTSLRRGSAYTIHELGTDAMDDYLPEWIAAALTDFIDSKVYSQDFVRSTRDTPSTDPLLSRFQDVLSQAEAEGELPEKYRKALEYVVGRVLRELPGDFAVASAIDARPIIKKYSLVLNAALQDTLRESLEDMHKEWLASQNLTAGKDYSIGDTRSVLIDKVTGTALPSHELSGLLDVMVDAREGKCRLKPRGRGDTASIGLYGYLQQAYGEDQSALVSGTIADLNSEIKPIMGKPVIRIDRWIGELVSPPSVSWKESYNDALSWLRDQIRECARSGKPWLLVSDNDYELEEIQRVVNQWQKDQPGAYAIDLITSSALSNAEEKAFSRVDVRHGIIANSRGGRMVDPVMTEEAAKAGGLHVIVWGSLSSPAVVKQVLDRTKRAGDDGDTSWVVYKTGGHCGLLEDPRVQELPMLTQKISRLAPGDRKFFGSVLEEVYDEKDLTTRYERMRNYMRDHLRERAWNGLLNHVVANEAFAKAATREYIEQWVKNQWGVDVEQVADSLVRTFIFRGQGPTGTYMGMVQTLGHSRDLIDEQLAGLIMRPEVSHAIEQHVGEIAQLKDTFDKVRIKNAEAPKPAKVVSPAKFSFEIDRGKKGKLRGKLLYSSAYPRNLYQLWSHRDLKGKNRAVEYGYGITSFDEEGRITRRAVITLEKEYASDQQTQEEAHFSKFRKFVVDACPDTLVGYTAGTALTELAQKVN